MTRMSRPPRRPTRCLGALLAALLLTALVPAHAAAAEDRPTVTLSAKEAGSGGKITVRGEGWPGKTLLLILICGQNMIGGTNSCANTDSRVATTDGSGRFTRELPVAEPPEPCPCVVHVAPVTGGSVFARTPIKIAGHETAPLPEDKGGEALAVLTQPRLEGTSGVLNWFGAPAERTLVVTLGNLGARPAKNPVVEVGLSSGVLAPQWERRQWRGTIEAGGKAEIKLPVELGAGDHGAYKISLRYGDHLLVEQPWTVGRPWGQLLFWALLFVVVPTLLLRIGLTVIDRVRPDGRHRASRRPAWDEDGLLPPLETSNG
ncbi:hypothetical protein AB0M28_16025 [Streptomyces sp. NPDC051940]|uniref:hypothetical protein n=1 Tax=Streptomyces sp. NPDC051940 TaxID=3155675 RepID=UPI0034468AE5